MIGQITHTVTHTDIQHVRTRGTNPSVLTNSYTSLEHKM